MATSYTVSWFISGGVRNTDFGTSIEHAKEFAAGRAKQDLNGIGYAVSEFNTDTGTDPQGHWLYKGNGEPVWVPVTGDGTAWPFEAQRG